MARLLTALGEEYVYTTDVDGVTLTVGLYNDSVDSIDDGTDYPDISTEPSNSNYSAVDDTFSVRNPTGTDITLSNDSDISFDFSDQTSSHNVDSYYVSVSFQSTVYLSDGSPTEHLVWTGPLAQTRDIGSIDTINIDATNIELELE